MRADADAERRGRSARAADPRARRPRRTAQGTPLGFATCSVRPPIASFKVYPGVINL